MALEYSKTLEAILEVLPDDPKKFNEDYRDRINELFKLENHEIEIENVRFTNFNHYRMYK
jgi:flagellar basal body-associated protein FliL